MKILIQFVSWVTDRPNEELHAALVGASFQSGGALWESPRNQDLRSRHLDDKMGDEQFDSAAIDGMRGRKRRWGYSTSDSFTRGRVRHDIGSRRNRGERTGCKGREGR